MNNQSPRAKGDLHNNLLGKFKQKVKIKIKICHLIKISTLSLRYSTCQVIIVWLTSLIYQIYLPEVTLGE